MEWLTISACLSLMRSLNRGNIEGANGLKIDVWFYTWISVLRLWSDWFSRLTCESIYIYIFEKRFWVCVLPTSNDCLKKNLNTYKFLKWKFLTYMSTKCVMPWDNRNGWLGIKHQITYLPFLYITKKTSWLLFHMVQNIFIYMKWFLCSVHLNFGNSTHKFLHINGFMFLKESSLGQSLNTYLCFRNTHARTHAHTHAHNVFPLKRIFCIGQINSWTFTMW